MTSFKFWQFGCWNNLNNKPDDSLDRYKNMIQFMTDKLTSKKVKPDLLIVSGDNYYPHKLEFKEESKAKEESKQSQEHISESDRLSKKNATIFRDRSTTTTTTTTTTTKSKPKKKEDTTKYKFIFTELLKQGLQSLPTLPTKIPIYMILGNHDLDTNTNDKGNLYIDSQSPKARESPKASLPVIPEPILAQIPETSKTHLRPENKECEIIQLELDAVDSNPNVNYIFCDATIVTNNTLLLMIDTSIYELDKSVEAYLPCYNKFFEHNKLYKEKQLNFKTVKDLRAYQLDKIIKAIKGAGRVKHLIR